MSAAGHGPPSRHPLAGGGRGRGRGTTAVVVVLASLALAGCQAKSEFDGRRYRHNGMRFSVAVPAGWAWKESEGDVLLELDGPAAQGLRVRPTVHVFSRRETARVDLEGAAEEFRRLLDEERRFDPMQAKTEWGAGAVASRPAEVSGLPARRLERKVREGATQVEQTMVVTAKGSQAWAVLVSVPEGSPGAESAVEEIIRSFEVW